MCKEYVQAKVCSIWPIGLNRSQQFWNLHEFASTKACSILSCKLLVKCCKHKHYRNTQIELQSPSTSCARRVQSPVLYMCYPDWISFASRRRHLRLRHLRSGAKVKLLMWRIGKCLYTVYKHFPILRVPQIICPLFSPIHVISINHDSENMVNNAWKTVGISWSYCFAIYISLTSHNPPAQVEKPVPLGQGAMFRVHRSPRLKAFKVLLLFNDCHLPGARAWNETRDGPKNSGGPSRLLMFASKNPKSKNLKNRCGKMLLTSPQGS